MFSYFYALKYYIVKLAKYIHELLLENETVIYPGFGAFISNYKPAEIRENEIIPPSREISFTRQFRNDDGVLVTSIARKAKISQPNAQKRIDRERENMFYLLDKGEKVTIENVGILFTNEKNEIQFTPFNDENLLSESFGFESVKIEDTVEKPDISETETATEQTIDTDEKAENETTETVDIRNEPVGEKPVEKFELPKSLPDWAIQEQPVKKKTTWYWYLLILIPVLIAGYFVFNNNSAPKNTENTNDKKVISENPVVQDQTMPANDSALIDSVQKMETESADAVKPEISIETSKYYIVGGGFKNEENAQKYIVRLKEKGIEGTMIGKKGNMYLVAIASYNTEQEAYNALNEMVKTNPEWKLWVSRK